MRWVAVLISVVWLALNVVSAAELISVSAQIPWLDRNGLTPVVVTLDPQADGVVLLEGRHHNQRASLTVPVRAGRSQRVTLLVPTDPRTWDSNVELRWSGDLGRGEERLYAQAHRSLELVVLDPTGVVDGAAWAGTATASSSTSGRRSIDPKRLTSADLPDRWQGYPSWLTLLVTDAGVAALTADQLAALGQWSRAGGAVVAADPGASSRLEAAGIRSVAASLAAPEPLRQRLQATRDQEHYAPSALSLPGLGQVPVVGFALLVVIFALVAGPLVIWWAVREKRRYLVLIVVPALSVGTCTVLVIWGLLADGLGVRRVAQQVCVLDGEARQATVWSAVTWFAGLPPGSLALPGDALPMSMDRDDWEEKGEAEWSAAAAWSAQGLSLSGWIPARTPRQGVIVRSVPERRRLVVQSGSQGAPVVTNGFDLALQNVVLRWSGQWWQLEHLAAGGTDTLKVHSMAATLPHAGLFGPGYDQAKTALEGQPMWFMAKMAAPLLPIPGPPATDVVTVETVVAGIPVLAPAVPRMSGVP